MEELIAAKAKGCRNDDAEARLQAMLEAYNAPGIRADNDAEIGRVIRELHDAGRQAGLFEGVAIRLSQLERRVAAVEEWQAGQSVSHSAKQAK